MYDSLKMLVCKVEAARPGFPARSRRPGRVAARGGGGWEDPAERSNMLLLLLE
jgi:hypothetical protein